MTVLLINLNNTAQNSNINRRMNINSQLVMTPELLSEYEKYRFEELHGGC